MTWKTPKGNRILAGAEARMIRETIDWMVDLIDADAEMGVPWSFEIDLFDRQQPPVQMALLSDVAVGLLCETGSIRSMNALREATVAAIFSCIQQGIAIEIDSEESADDTKHRQVVIDAAEEVQKDDSTNLPHPLCCDMDEWETVVEGLSSRILWDRDFELESLTDLCPEDIQKVKSSTGINQQYFSAIPPEPTADELNQHRDLLRKLCRTAPDASAD